MKANNIKPENLVVQYELEEQKEGAEEFLVPTRNDSSSTNLNLSSKKRNSMLSKSNSIENAIFGMLGF